MPACWLAAVLLLVPSGARGVPVLPGAPPPPLDTWSFNDTNGWTSDLGFAPLSFTNLSASPLGDGYAVVVDSTNSAWLRYNVSEADGTNNLSVDNGSVVLWFAPSWSGTNVGGGGVPGGQWGRLFEVGQYTDDASYGWWSIYLDPAGANVYFGAQTNGAGSVYLSAPISWTTNRWHQVALTYSATTVSLYLDGALATNTTGLTYWPGPGVLANGFWIGSASNGVAQAHGMFDDVETYNYVLDADTISSSYDYDSFLYYMNPMNSANFTSAPSYPSTNSFGAFDLVTGQGFLEPVGTNSSGCFESPDVWFTNVSASITAPESVAVTFTIAGGSNNVLYDVFATGALDYPITNAQWAWMGQGYHCATYTIPNLPLQSAFLILGLPNDSDGDGLTDAYELLVSHTATNNPSTFGGLPDGWVVLNGLMDNPNVASQDPDRDGLNNGQEYLYGTKPLVPEGIAIWTASP